MLIYYSPLDNTKSTDVRAYPDFLTFQEGKSTVELINSTFKGGIETEWDIVKETESASLDLTLTNSDLSSTLLFISSSLPPGRNITKQLIENVNVIAKDSSLRGSVIIRPNDNGNIDDTFNISLHNSKWDIGEYSKNPKVTNLTLQNSNVDINSPVRPLYQLLNGKDIKDIPFDSAEHNDIEVEQLRSQYTPKFHIFEILGNLEGEGIFQLNTDLAAQASDQIIVHGSDSGSFRLDVTDSRREPKAANGKVTLVKTSGNGEAQFSLLNRDYVDAGAYRYRLSKEQNDWVLSNKQAEPTKPVEPIKPTETVKPVEPTKPAETAKPVAPAKPAETVKPVELTKPAETAKPVEPTKPTETVKPVEPTKPAETAKPVEPVKPMETVKPVEPVKPTETVKPVELVKPTETAKPVEPTKPVETAQTSSDKVMLSGTSNALVGLRQAQLLQLEQGLVGIYQRLGKQKQVGNLGVWVRNVNNRSELASTNTASNSNTSGFEQDSHQIQVGVDVAINDGWRVGGFVENSRANVDFNGEYGSGKVKGQGVGLIFTYQGNGGFYLDNVAKYSRLKATSDYTNSQRYHGYSLSSEISKAFELGKFTLTPNAQLAWHSLSGKENEDRLSSLYARVGARLATHFDVASWKLQPYFEINGISSKNRSSQVRVNQYAFDVAGSRGRVENALGVNIAKGQHRFGIEAKTAYGKRLDQPFALQAVYRYQW